MSQQYRARKSLRARKRGLTLVEIMVVIVIIGLIAGAAGFQVLAYLERAKIKTTRTDAIAIKQAVVTFLTEGSGGDCPSVEQLADDHVLDGHDNRDAWNRDFEIVCDGTAVTVSSAGPDGERGTDDDISSL